MFPNDLSTVRLNQSYSMPNIHDERFNHSYTYPYPTLPQRIIPSQSIYYPPPNHHPGYWHNPNQYAQQQQIIKPP